MTSRLVPEHGEILVRLAAFLLPLADTAGLCVAAPANIGDQQTWTLSDLAVYPANEERTPGLLSRGVVLVVDIGQSDEGRFQFYRDWGVKEYLAIDPAKKTVELWVWAEQQGQGPEGWVLDAESQALGFLVVRDGLLAPEAQGATFHLQRFISP